MKWILSISIILTNVFTSCTAQSSYSYYNGKKWEQINGNGKLVKLNPQVSSFTSLDISHMNAKIIVITGATDYSLNISIDENLKEFFRYKQEGSTLKLSFDLSGGKYDRWLSTNNTVISIRVPALEAINNSGNAKIECKELNQQTFSLISSGNASISLSGTVNNVLLQTKGNSDIHAGTLIAETTTLSSSGNAEFVVNTKELIETNMNGSNDITNLFGNTTPVVKKNIELEYVRFKIKNNSLLPVKLSVISYRPDEKGNGTSIFVLPPYSSKAFRFPAGTKIYLANEEQVNTVMGGKKISDQPPFLLVKKEDRNKTININQ
ncbi:MAG: DUF2807 domain-containing protein [Chitinophagaceae bacterium]|jgi:hypothetical protein|nr:DUF2807 domain-containing protein [Chitinophagaceae bacterium]